MAALNLDELLVIHQLREKVAWISGITWRTGLNRKTVRKYLIDDLDPLPFPLGEGPFGTPFPLSPLGRTGRGFTAMEVCVILARHP